MDGTKEKRMENKVAVLTGASGGIGAAIAEMLGALRMCVVLAGRDADRLGQAAKAVASAGGEALVCKGDLTKLPFTGRLIVDTLERFGGIDVLINCAGIAQNASFKDITEAEFDAIMTLNVKVPYFLTQQALPFLEKSDCATIVNICSVVAHLGYPQQSVYAASKHAMLGWSKSLANEVYEKNIRVHAICPGGVYTDMGALTRPELRPEEMILPEDIADAVRFLLLHRHTNAVIDEIGLHRASKAPFLY